MFLQTWGTSAVLNNGTLLLAGLLWVALEIHVFCSENNLENSAQLQDPPPQALVNNLKVVVPIQDLAWDPWDGKYTVEPSCTCIPI